MNATSDEVEIFIRSRKARPHWGPVPEDRRPRSLDDGYRLQHAIHRALAGQGITHVGYKIGCTSSAGQRGFGLDEPVHAGMFDTTRAANLREALAIPLLSPLIECEIAFTMVSALDGTADLSDAALSEAVGSAHLACEVVDARYGVPATEIGAPTLLTDDFLHSAFVLGPAVAGWRDLPLERLSGVIEIDDQLFTGSSAEVLTPFQSLRWLIGKLARHGQRLEAGAIVLTGSLVPPTPITLPARHVAIAIEGFGRLTLAD